MSTVPQAIELATRHHQAGQLEVAEQVCRQILEVDPNQAEALHILGLIARQVGQYELSVDLIKRAIAVNGGAVILHNNLGDSYSALGKLSEAVSCYRRALNLNPGVAEVYFNLGNALKDQGKMEEATASFRRTIQLKPAFAEAHDNLGSTLRYRAKFEEAIASHRRAIKLRPNLAGAHTNLGNALMNEGRLDEAIACHRKALALQPTLAAVHSNLLLAKQYGLEASLPALAAAHAEYEREQAAPLRLEWRPHGNSRDPNRKLRIGLLSADFGIHPVGYFLIRMLENFDRGQADIVCYCDRHTVDPLTERFQRSATSWRNVAGHGDAQIVEQIRQDQIDILFDLAGHTGNNRLLVLVLARKPAPIQITWIGYEGTTGLEAIDYILADSHVLPVVAEPYYCERALRMPHGYLCYEPPASAPGLSPLPA